MKKIAQGIVRLRKLILTVAVLLLIPSAIGAIATRINYDILTYLPQDLDSMIGEVALEDDFHLASTGMITVEGLPTNELIAMKKEIEAVPGVTQTFWLSDVIDPNIPTEMLPADVQQNGVQVRKRATNLLMGVSLYSPLGTLSPPRWRPSSTASIICCIWSPPARMRERTA